MPDSVSGLKVISLRSTLMFLNFVVAFSTQYFADLRCGSADGVTFQLSWALWALLGPLRECSFSKLTREQNSFCLVVARCLRVNLNLCKIDFVEPFSVLYPSFVANFEHCSSRWP